VIDERLAMKEKGCQASESKAGQYFQKTRLCNCFRYAIVMPVLQGRNEQGGLKYVQNMTTRERAESRSYCK